MPFGDKQWHTALMVDAKCDDVNTTLLDVGELKSFY